MNTKLLSILVLFIVLCGCKTESLDDLVIQGNYESSLIKPDSSGVATTLQGLHIQIGTTITTTNNSTRQLNVDLNEASYEEVKDGKFLIDSIKYFLADQDTLFLENPIEVAIYYEILSEKEIKIRGIIDESWIFFIREE